MTPRPANRNYAFSEAFVEELTRSGVHHACICPGSRSTPLAMTLAKQTAIRIWIHLDERSASYFALGIGRALNEPAAVVSTSGTAAANFFPAVVEAHYSHVPMLIVTADRPPELWEWGANQTIDQPSMYGNHAKWSVNFATPEVTVDLLRYVREMTCRSVGTAVESPAGPVHINFPFREPLVPENVPADFPDTSSAAQNYWTPREQGAAYTRIESGKRAVDPERIKELAHSLSRTRNGIIVCGQQQDSAFPSTVSLLAQRCGFPILADPLSQVRCGTHDRSLVIDSYDGFLRSKKTAQALEPDMVLRFGATPTSKTLQSYLALHHQARQILVHESDWQDPMHVATDMFQTNPSQFASDLSGMLEISPNKEWTERWLSFRDLARTTMLKHLDEIGEMFEGKIFNQLAKLIPSKATLLAGNSMPVRDLDSFFPSNSKQTRFLANRGASGIDGVLSTALGTSAVSLDPTVLVVGDLSFYHDMNGLLAAKKYGLNATIVLANNNGGGIFSFLPQHEYPESFEKYFGTPHGLSFQTAAALYDLPYSKVTSWDGFDSAVSGNVNRSRTAIIEMQTERERNVELHRKIWSAVQTATESKLM